MLEEPKDRPTSFSQRGVGLSISLDVADQLGLPVVPVGSGKLPVIGTPMPETAIDEDGDLGSRKCDVRAHSAFLKLQRQVFSEPQTQLV
jgi:hypothetical protein